MIEIHVCAGVQDLCSLNRKTELRLLQVYLKNKHHNIKVYTDLNDYP
jgi:hypothetical protein